MMLVLSRAADRDIELILQETLNLFGPKQVDTYAGLIESTLDSIAADPLRPSSIDRFDLGPRFRSLQGSLAGGRRRSASHVAYYLPPLERGEQVIYVIRVLHQSMDPLPHLQAGPRGSPLL